MYRIPIKESDVFVTKFAFRHKFPDARSYGRTSGRTHHLRAAIGSSRVGVGSARRNGRTDGRTEGQPNSNGRTNVVAIVDRLEAKKLPDLFTVEKRIA